jgi:hypothetical protein
MNWALLVLVFKWFGFEMVGSIAIKWFKPDKLVRPFKNWTIFLDFKWLKKIVA